MINVSIVTYKTDKNEVKDTISTCASSPYVNKIYIVDNSPDDTLKRFLEDANDKISYLHNPSNPGYGAAHNIAMQLSIQEKTPYHLVLNADTVFDPEIFEGILDYFQSNRRVGLIAPKMINEDGTFQCSRKLLPSPLNMFFRAFLPIKFRSKLDSKYQLEFFGDEKAIFVPYVSGAFMFIKTDVLEKVGIFDERFFMYPEDIDLSRRIAEKYLVQFLPKFELIHKYGNATRKSLRMFLIHAYNMCLYFNKWGWLFDKNRLLLNKDTLNQDMSRYLNNGERNET